MGLLTTKIDSSTITNMCGFLQNKKESDTFFVQAPAFVLILNQRNPAEGELSQLSPMTA